MKTETENADEQAEFKEGDKRPSHKSQNTDAKGTRAPATALCALWTSRRQSTRSPMISDNDGHDITSAID